MLKEINLEDAMNRALMRGKGLLVTMPQTIEKLTIEELLNLEKAGAKFLLEELPVPAVCEPAITIESMEDAPNTPPQG